MKILRTPEERFSAVPDFPFAPRYTEVENLRMAHVEAGGGPVVLMLHGEPTWSFLYRKMIPVFADAGFRAVAPDLIGFGRSDKPAALTDYSYAAHVRWTAAWIEALDLRDITLVCQDWGSLIGLRLAAERPERFSRIVVANGFLPIADRPTPVAFRAWRAFARYTPVFPIGRIVQAGSTRRLTSDDVAAYDAPFPSEHYKAGARAFPRLVPTDPADPAIPANRAAWDALHRWDKPFLTAFGKKDPILGWADRILQRHVPGARGQPHRDLAQAGHFVQEDAGPELAKLTVDWMQQ
ncbi:MAG: haloalkane dehalogenase [Gammaproteobacteria bacterium SG8_31]|jgi:haloalkane dehalogenase|nr:MAG: haloalkane dehalogenase [Gammaproteobacteria bacterium SG8_31]